MESEYWASWKESGNYLNYLHCKKSWRSSSTPASGDAGPIHTGVEKSFRHPWRKFYYKYQTFPTFFTSVELVCYDLDDSRQTYCLQMSNFFDKTWMPQNYSDTTRERTYVFRFSFHYYQCATLSHTVLYFPGHIKKNKAMKSGFIWEIK